MKIFCKRVDDDETIIEAGSVALCFESAEEALDFAKFALRSSEIFESLGEDYSHEHFRGGMMPDVTIERLIEETF